MWKRLYNLAIYLSLNKILLTTEKNSKQWSDKQNILLSEKDAFMQWNVKFMVLG
jgi:hypothetical protein